MRDRRRSLEKYARTYLRTTVQTAAATIRGSLRGTFSKMRLSMFSPTKGSGSAKELASQEALDSTAVIAPAPTAPLSPKHVPPATAEVLPPASSALGKVISCSKVR